MWATWIRTRSARDDPARWRAGVAHADKVLAGAREMREGSEIDGCRSLDYRPTARSISERSSLLDFSRGFSAAIFRAFASSWPARCG